MVSPLKGPSLLLRTVVPVQRRLMAERSLAHTAELPFTPEGLSMSPAGRPIHPSPLYPDLGPGRFIIVVGLMVRSGSINDVGLSPTHSVTPYHLFPTRRQPGVFRGAMQACRPVRSDCYALSLYYTFGASKSSLGRQSTSTRGRVRGSPRIVCFPLNWP